MEYIILSQTTTTSGTVLVTPLHCPKNFAKEIIKFGKNDGKGYTAQFVMDYEEENYRVMLINAFNTIYDLGFCFKGSIPTESGLGNLIFFEKQPQIVECDSLKETSSVKPSSACKPATTSTSIPKSAVSPTSAPKPVTSTVVSKSNVQNDRAKDSLYFDAVTDMQFGDYKNAIAKFESIKGYKDVDTLLAECYSKCRR